MREVAKMPENCFEVTISSVKVSEQGGEYKLYTDIGEYRITAADFKALGLPTLDKETAYPCCVMLPDSDTLAFLSEKLGAVKYLSYLLSFGDKSEKKLLMKLKEKEYSTEASKAATQLLKKNGILDETAICARKIRYFATAKYFGPYRIKSELKAKGFADSAIKEAFVQVLDEVDFDESLEKLCKKLVGRKKVTDKVKLSASLSRYGYGYSEIKDVVGKYLSDSDTDSYFGDFPPDD